MDQGVRLVRFDGDESQTITQAPLAQVELKHFRNVTRSVTQDALNVWAELWAELENDIVCGVAAAPEGEKGLGTPIAKDRDWEPFKPSCGWPEFLEKMWVLRQNLDFLARFSRPSDDGSRPSGPDSQLLS